ncbi:hypothetical protein ABIE80_008588 [Bradyrhizobium diazoefficiens]
MHRGEQGARQQRDLHVIRIRQQPHQRRVHQREGVHHHLKDVVRIGAIVLHPMLEQRTQQIRVLRKEFEIGLGKPVELADRILGRNPRKPRCERLNGLPIDGQDHPVEVAELVIDAADRAAGGFGDVTNLQ